MTRTQTLLRLQSELLARARRKARQRNISFNRFIEELLERETDLVFPPLPAEISDEIRSLQCMEWKEPDQAEREADPKLAALWEKYNTL